MISLSRLTSKRTVQFTRFFGSSNIHPDIDPSNVKSKAMRKKLEQGRAVMNVPQTDSTPQNYNPVDQNTQFQQQFSFTDSLKHNFVAGVGISLAFIVIGSIFRGMGF